MVGGGEGSWWNYREREVMNHREVGRALGFPPCCVEQFAVDMDIGSMPARLRGAVFSLTHELVLTFYVPCWECLSKKPEGWLDYDDVLGDALQYVFPSRTYRDGEVTLRPPVDGKISDLYRGEIDG